MHMNRPKERQQLKTRINNIGIAYDDHGAGQPILFLHAFPLNRSMWKSQIEALLKEHPEWVQPDGESPICEAYESRLAELLGLSSWSEHPSVA